MKLFLNLVVGLSGFAIIIFVTYIHLTDEPVEDLLTVAAIGAFLMVFAVRGSLESFAVGPVTARMKQVVQEAEKALDDLRRVAQPFSELSFALIRATHFPVGGIPRDRVREMEIELIRLLSDLKVSAADVTRLREPLHAVYISSLLDDIRTPIREYLDNAHSAVEALYHLRRKQFGADNPDTIRTLELERALQSRTNVFRNIPYDFKAYDTFVENFLATPILDDKDRAQLLRTIEPLMQTLSHYCTHHILPDGDE